MSRLLAALLPAVIPSDAREHVLGDLAERGNRLRDYITVIPAAWFAHLRRYFAREWTGPIPSFAPASNDAILARAAQLRRATRWSLGFLLGTSLSGFATEDPSSQRNPWMLFWMFVWMFALLGILVAFCAKLLGERRERRRAPLDAYRRALSDIQLNAMVPMNLWITMNVWLHGPHTLVFRPDGGTVLVLNVASFLALAALCAHRLRRFRRERKALA